MRSSEKCGLCDSNNISEPRKQKQSSLFCIQTIRLRGGQRRQVKRNRCYARHTNTSVTAWMFLNEFHASSVARVSLARTHGSPLINGCRREHLRIECCFSFGKRKGINRLDAIYRHRRSVAWMLRKADSAEFTRHKRITYILDFLCIKWQSEITERFSFS